MLWEHVAAGSNPVIHTNFMTTTRISLGGENAGYGASGERSSRSSSTIYVHWSRTRLWKKLKSLDKKISTLQKHFRFGYDWAVTIYGNGDRNKVVKLRERIEKLDEQRKLVRLERKKYSVKHRTHE